ncbi:MAG: metal ABC transporter permease [Acetobacteraceae bacterium]|nr:metal ABC transporter permease [Acetobacteraceae bacterium]
MWEALAFRAGHNAAVVALGCIAFGLAAGAVGCFVLLRGRALIADAAAHATLPGIAAAFLLALPLGLDPRALPWLLAGGAVTALLGVVAAHALASSGRVKDDAAIAVALSAFFGLGAVLLSVVQALPVAGQAGLSGLLLGRAAGMTAADAATMAVVAGIALGLLLLLRRPLAALLFDPLQARLAGLPAGALDAALLGLMLLVVLAGLPAVGLVLVVALLIVPAAAARLLVVRLPAMVALSAAFGAGASHLGVALSASAPGLPTGATIVLVALAGFLLALLLSPRRGLIAAFRRQAALMAAARAAAR